jgi:hypothetical protein
LRGDVVFGTLEFHVNKFSQKGKGFVRIMRASPI